MVNKKRYDNYPALELKLVTLIFILTVSIYIIFMDGNMTSDGYFYFLCAESIIRDHDLSIEPNFPYGNPVDPRSPHGINGKKYLYNHFGWAVLLLPLTALGVVVAKFLPYKTAAMAIASTTNCFITALTVLILYLFSRRLKYSPRTSTLLSLLYGFSTMAFPYATNSFCEPANTLMILISVFCLYGYKQKNSYIMLALSSLSLGYACFIRIWDLFLLPGFIFYIFYYLKQTKNLKFFKTLLILIIFLVPILGMIILNESYFYITRGSSYFFGEGCKTNEGLSAFAEFLPFHTLPKGLYGLIFSPGKGFFFYNPILILALFSLRNFYLRYRQEGFIFIYIFLSHLIFIGSLTTAWSGDLAWGPRYLLPVIPFLILVLGEKQKNKFWPKLFWIGALVSLLVQIPPLLVDTDLWAIDAVGKGHKIEEVYFKAKLSPLLGTWKMLYKEISSFSKDKSNGLSPFFFRIFDREISTQRGEMITISIKFSLLVSSVIIGLIFMAAVSTYRIICLLQQIKGTPSLS